MPGALIGGQVCFLSCPHPEQNDSELPFDVGLKCLPPGCPGSSYSTGL